MPTDYAALDSQMSRLTRGTLLAARVAAWGGGAAATFVSDNGAGSAALIASGLVAAALGAVGRWPDKLVISGNEMTWNQVRGVVKSQLDSARSEDAGEETISQLEDLMHRLEVLEQTGRAPATSAAAYDDEVVAAIRAVRPDLTVHSHEQRSAFEPDFKVESHSDRVWVETKWRSNPTSPFRGRTLASIANGLSEPERLLVVTNATDIVGGAEALRQHLGDRGRVLGWSRPADNTALKRVLDEMLPVRPTSSWCGGAGLVV